MRITNKYNLPDPIHSACLNDDYSKGDCDYTVTQLINPSWMNYLYQKHYDEIEIDCSDNLYALMGKAIHKILENCDSNYIQEKRLFMKINDRVISGQIDLFDCVNNIIYDYKFSSIWEWIYGLKAEKIQQLNMYRLLMLENSHKVNDLKNVFLFRDWSYEKAKYDKKYPQRQIAIVDVPVWNDEDILTFCKKRVFEIENPVPCTKHEKWCRDETWAAMKRGRKKAVKLFYSEKAAKMFIADTDYYIQYRPGENKRCLHYCNVSKFCEHKDY